MAIKTAEVSKEELEKAYRDFIEISCVFLENGVPMDYITTMQATACRLASLVWGLDEEDSKKALSVFITNKLREASEQQKNQITNFMQSPGKA